jgi:hypothetical protein
MSKVKPITRGLVSEWNIASAEVGKMENQIVDRIDYIIRTWFQVFDSKLDYWYFDGAEEGQVGDLKNHMDSYNISNIWTECKKDCSHEMVILDKNGDEYGWESAILTRWLFEDFEDEIINGKKLYLEKEIERKAKKKIASAQKKIEDTLLVEEAKKKLSKEELAALKRNL